MKHILNIINECFEFSLSEKNVNIQLTLSHILCELCKYLGIDQGFICEKWTNDDNEIYFKYYALHGIELDDQYKKLGYTTDLPANFEKLLQYYPELCKVAQPENTDFYIKTN